MTSEESQAEVAERRVMEGGEEGGGIGLGRILFQSEAAVEFLGAASRARERVVAIEWGEMRTFGPDKSSRRRKPRSFTADA